MPRIPIPNPAALVVAVTIVLAACATNSAEQTTTTAVATTRALPTTTTSSLSNITTVPEATSTTSAPASAEIVGIVESAVAEWNTGELPRWRATFADEAFVRIASDVYPIEILQDEYQFFTILGRQLTLMGCSAADGDAGEAVLCDATSSDLFSDGLGVSSIDVRFYFDLVDGLIVNFGQNFSGAGSIRSAWLEFAGWVGEQDPEDGEAMAGFPGDAQSAETALNYIDDWSQSG